MVQELELKTKKIFALIATVVFITATILGIIFIPQILPDNNTTKDYEDITVSAAYNMINDTISYPNLIILDVRNEGEYDSGHLNNSILIPLGELVNQLDEIVQYNNTEIIVHCLSGTRSASASEILASNGFSKIYNMLGGISAWTDAGYPTV
jgi:rhodanese-related sulfurtransferase